MPPAKLPGAYRRAAAPGAMRLVVGISQFQQHHFDSHSRGFSLAPPPGQQVSAFARALVTAPASSLLCSGRPPPLGPRLRPHFPTLRYPLPPLTAPVFRSAKGLRPTPAASLCTKPETCRLSFHSLPYPIVESIQTLPAPRHEWTGTAAQLLTTAVPVVSNPPKASSGNSIGVRKLSPPPASR
jgi:hypothetical protein